MTKKIEPGYISFIDILGTKNLSRFDSEEYSSKLINFFTVLIRHISEDDDAAIKIFYFSDSVFVESKELEKLIVYLQKIRKELISRQIFIKASVTYGKLDAIDDLSNYSQFRKNYEEKYSDLFLTLKKNEQNKKLKQNIKGTLFLSVDIARAYYLQDSLKGIGIRFDPALLDQALFDSKDARMHHDIYKKYCVESFFLKTTDSTSIEKFIDLKFSVKDGIDNAIVNLIFKQYKTSNIYNKSYGRYYLSLIFTLIRSENLSKIEVDEHGKLDKDSLSFLIQRILYINNSKEGMQLYERSVGLEYLFLGIINEYYNDVKNRTLDKSKALLFKIIEKKKFIGKYLNNFETIPGFIITTKNKNQLISEYSSLNT